MTGEGEDPFIYLMVVDKISSGDGVTRVNINVIKM